MYLGGCFGFTGTRLASNEMTRKSLMGDVHVIPGHQNGNFIMTSTKRGIASLITRREELGADC